MGAPPGGHDCAGAEYCDTCGVRVSGPRIAPESARPAAWVAVVSPDRGYFNSVIAEKGPDAAKAAFPSSCLERVFQLSGPQMRIGRGSVSRGVVPEIDLASPPTDRGISHLHAVLLSDDEGCWAVMDLGSANGTRINGKELETGTRVPLRHGDQISLGAWTVVTIRAG